MERPFDEVRVKKIPLHVNLALTGSVLCGLNK